MSVLLNDSQLKKFQDKYLKRILLTPFKKIKVNSEFPSDSTFWVHYYFGFGKTLILCCRNGKPFHGEITLFYNESVFHEHEEITERSKEIFEALQPSVTKLYENFVKKAYF